MSATPPPPPPPPQQPYGGQQPQLSPADEKLWATLIHIGGILFSFIPALVGYLVLKDRGPFIRSHTATARSGPWTPTWTCTEKVLLRHATYFRPSSTRW